MAMTMVVGATFALPSGAFPVILSALLPPHSLSPRDINLTSIKYTHLHPRGHRQDACDFALAFEIARRPNRDSWNVYNESKVVDMTVSTDFGLTRVSTALTIIRNAAT
ncbi:hypothetical protein EV702DRAFT_1042302 [Suillus placidus]|uniref:Secreted protein n=1 Tax=Suillus placidus TaxID=48579 RepID=A0A9P7A2R1_9AGAM|nr:hypothetical protein EV702DRAFT_1042302 [Suillus placidus]